MSYQIQISVKCPLCQESLMNESVRIDDLPSIEIEAKMKKNLGKIYLSQIYGSYTKKFIKVKDEVGTIASLSCPHCHQPLPIIQKCDCQAPMVGMQLEIGGIIKICSRNGCKRHSLEFEDVNDAFMLLMRGDQTGLG